MVSSWVKVNGPTNRDVFVGYNFTAPAGRTNEPFRVPHGGNTFILLTPNLIIEARTLAYVAGADETAPFIVELWPMPLPPRAAVQTPMATPHP
jgi:hypothetical protein